MRWGTVRKKLISSGYVEYFNVKIDQKIKACLRLLDHPYKGTFALMNLFSANFMIIIDNNMNRSQQIE